MKILDWYILKKFISTYVFVVLMLVAVICIIDFTEKNDDFIKNNVSIREILFDYYLNVIPFYANMLSPITVFIATVFVTAKLASHTEIVAMLSSGISFARLLKPYLIGSALIAALIFALIAFVIPNANKTRVAFEVAYIKNPFSYDNRNIHIKVAPEQFVYMESYDNTNNIGYKFSLEHIQGLNLLSKLNANRIEWQPEKNKWRLEDYKLHTFDGEKENIIRGSFLDTVVAMYPKDFASTYRLAETFTLPELNQFIEDKRQRGADDIEIYLIEKYERFSYPFTIIILTVIGVILSSRKARGGVGFQIALGFLLAFLFIIFVIMMRSFAQVGDINPMYAPWIPAIIFSFIGAVLYKYVPR